MTVSSMQDRFEHVIVAIFVLDRLTKLKTHNRTMFIRLERIADQQAIR